VWSFRLLKNTVWDPAWTSSPTRARAATSPSPSCLGEPRWLGFGEVASSIPKCYDVDVLWWDALTGAFGSSVLPNADAGRMLGMIGRARMCPSEPGVTPRPSCSTSSSTLWAFTTNSPAQIETAMSKSGGTRLKMVGWTEIRPCHYQRVSRQKQHKHTLKLRSHQKRCTFSVRVGPMQSQCTNVNDYDCRGFSPGSAFAKIARREHFASFASISTLAKNSPDVELKANQCWDAPPLVNLTGCYCSNGAGSSRYSDLVMQVMSCVSLRVMLCIHISAVKNNALTQLIQLQV